MQAEEGFYEDGKIFAAHPDPSWARRNWRSLDGVWTIRRRGLEREIRVPFPVGSEASGVDFPDRGLFVYGRDFDLGELRPGRRWLLRVGACDYRARVLLNGEELGRHVGGYASFEFDLGDAVRPGKNSLRIEVRDSHSPSQVRGKQTFLPKPFFVWYAGLSGLWQSVWLEETGPCRLGRCRAEADFRGRRLVLSLPFSAAAPGGPGVDPARLRLVARIGPAEGPGAAAVAEVGVAQASAAGGRFELAFGFDEFDAALWSPDSPRLHPLRLTLLSGDDELDEVESYVGLREVRVGKAGLSINGEPVYLRMVLDQGYYPRGAYAPETVSRQVEDLKAVKELGYNGVRVHQKVESPYFSYLCDRLGILTSFEMPSFYRPSARAFRRYEAELRELVERDRVHPSCVLRMLFNETWGIWGIYRRRGKTRAFVERMYLLAKELDPTRPVIENSGWEHFRTDLLDLHHYLRSATLARELYRDLAEGKERVLGDFSVRRVLAFNLLNQVATETRSLFLERPAGTEGLPLFLSEYGGFGWYEAEGSALESLEEYTKDIVESGLFCGYCYTQLYDVGSEVNGLLDFARRPKVDPSRVRRANEVGGPGTSP